MTFGQAFVGAHDQCRQRVPPDVEVVKPTKSNAYKAKLMVICISGEPRKEYDFDGRFEIHAVVSLRVAEELCSPPAR